MLKRIAQRLTGGKPPHSPAGNFLEQASEAERQLVAKVRPYTLTSPERIAALAEAVRYVVQRGVPGALAECGVWRGGSVLTMVLTLQSLGVDDRDIYLYDTFEGMTKPSDLDTSDFDTPALSQWNKSTRKGGLAWPHWFNKETFNIDLVKGLLRDTGYPSERLIFVQGTVEQTIPHTAPEQLALLRLDTDWYESTRHELLHLYPRLNSGGVLLIDDYGHWQGCRKAVDEYFASGQAAPLLLNRVDYSCRMAVKA